MLENILNIRTFFETWTALVKSFRLVILVKEINLDANLTWEKFNLLS